MGVLHTSFEGFVDGRFVGFGEIAQVYRLSGTPGGRGQVGIETVGKERRNGSHERSHRFEAGVECLVSRKFVGIHVPAPETFAVEAHIPVAEVVIDKVRYGTAGTRRFIIGIVSVDLFDKRIEQRDNPTVDFGTLRYRYFRFCKGKSVDVGIEGKERIGVVERAEELAANLFYAVEVEFEVIPRR